MSFNDKKTSSEIATLASNVLQDPNSSTDGKSFAGSALSQVNGERQTGANLEALAARALQNPHSTSNERSLAGSILAQSNKER